MLSDAPLSGWFDCDFLVTSALDTDYASFHLCVLSVQQIVPDTVSAACLTPVWYTKVYSGLESSA